MTNLGITIFNKRVGMEGHTDTYTIACMLTGSIEKAMM